MSKKVLVTGANGQLGQSIRKMSGDYPQYDFIYIDIEDLDSTSPAAIEEYFNQKSCDFIINCAAYTAVDKAESDQDLAEAINHLAVKALAEICKQKDMALIHVSTDYVFDGQNFRPYVETDSVAPQSVYGMTKLKGEQAFQNCAAKGAIIRTSWLYSEFGQNFVKTMLRLGVERDKLTVIFDQIGTPTYAGDLAKAILDSLFQLETKTAELYHFSNEGVCSWYDFAKAIFDLRLVSCQVAAIETKDYPTPAKRPHYSLLNKSKIKQDLNLDIPYWRDSLVRCLAALQG